MLCLSLACAIVMIEIYQWLSAVCIDSLVCPTFAQNSACGAIAGARRLRDCGAAARLELSRVWSDLSLGFRTDSGSEVILDP